MLRREELGRRSPLGLEPQGLGYFLSASASFPGLYPGPKHSLPAPLALSPCSEGAHLLPARGALCSHIIMHIRYKQSCLIILRHISDRVINKHCKINEEKCDLQFPLIGKALAFPRHKVITLGLRRGEGQGQGPLSPQRPNPSHTQLCPHPALPRTPHSCLLSSGRVESWDGRRQGWKYQWPRGPRPHPSGLKPSGTAV